MAISEIFFLITLTIIILLLFISSKIMKKTSLPTNWPLFGMLPGLLQNCHHVHAYTAEILTETGGTFHFKFPWYLKMDMLLTSDPANIHYIFSKNFTNYQKGPEFKKYFEILGEGIFNVDSDLWELHRRTTLSFMTHPDFNNLLERSVGPKIETGLLPVLDYFSDRGADLDLQDIFQRLTFDSVCKLLLDHDPATLAAELPYVECERGFNDAIEALLYRHVLPDGIWRLQRWLGIGNEKKLDHAWKAVDEFIYPRLGKKTDDTNRNDDLNLLASFKKAYEERDDTVSDDVVGSRVFLRDTALSLIFAGRDTTSTCLTWLFCLVARNPSKGKKILEEIDAHFHAKSDKKSRVFDVSDTKKLVYLHGALCESLRLFPPVPLQHKTPIRPDYLPSGDYIERNTRIIVSFYTVGRMEDVWGKDCLEFKPERWISPRGGIKHEPSYKFPVFNVGPRTCLGKDMAFVQMKMIAATVLYYYNVGLVEGRDVSPRDSIVLQARYGLWVKLSKRNVS